MKEEMESMLDNKVFTLCYLPSNRKSMIKSDAHNKFKKFPARIAAKSYSQIIHLDFEERYAPVVRIDSVRHGTSR